MVRDLAALWLIAAVGLDAGGAAAGAWPRAPGEGFLSVGLEAEPEGSGGANFTLYGEYGLTERATLVTKLDGSDDPGTPRRAGAGLRFALNGPEATNRFAASLGVSVPPDVEGAMTGTRVELGLAWGRGFESAWGGGWATGAARLLVPASGGSSANEVSGLVGLRPAEGWMTMLGASRYAEGDGVYWRVSPSVGYVLREGVSIVPGVTREFGDAERWILGLALWIDF